MLKALSKALRMAEAIDHKKVCFRPSRLLSKVIGSVNTAVPMMIKATGNVDKFGEGAS